MSNTKTHAEVELNVLVKTVPDTIIKDFVPEILELCEKFGNSGQSGGSAPYTARALSQAIEKLCLQQPICPLTGIDEEWVDISETGIGNIMYQNKRCGGLFKDSKDGEAYYVDAIVFEGQNGYRFTSSNSVKLKSGDTIGSKQFIKEFPFTPKTFYVDVIETEWADKNGTEEKQGGGWWTSVIKDEKQLEEVWEYYKRS